VRRRDTWFLNLEALWARFNGERIAPGRTDRILLAGSGTFLPYPVSLANPRVRVLALDLSAASLRRARLHALRQLRLNLDFEAGDLMDTLAAPGPFRCIDAFGVLHCIPDYGGALRALAARLGEGGILRVMVYGRDGRAAVEAFRGRCAALGIERPSQVRALARRDSELRTLIRGSFELGFASGLADAFLLPWARTFTVDEALSPLASSGLRLLAFCHQGALPDTGRELERIRGLERGRAFPTNIAFYLGREADAGRRKGAGPGKRAWIELNPALKVALLAPLPATIRLPPRTGPDIPPIGPEERRFLTRFRSPVAAAGLPKRELALARPWIERMVLMDYD
jgi:SAM-dependent methyltransferase